MSRIVLKYEGTVKNLNQLNKEYRSEFQDLIGTYLDKVRSETAEKDIIKNTTGSINPYLARRKQPSTYGRMTDRTGKFRLMLKDKATPHGSGFKGGLRKSKKTLALSLIVSRDRKKTDLEGYTGTMRYDYKGGGRLTSTGHTSYRPLMMPKENEDTLFMRFLWDLKGLHGQGPRRTLSKRAPMVLIETKRLAGKRLDKLATNFNKL